MRPRRCNCQHKRPALSKVCITISVENVDYSELMRIQRSEISPAKQRGRFVVMNHIGFVAGLAVGFW